MFVIRNNLHIKTGVLNLAIDLSLHSQLFRVYCYCIDLDHIIALVTVAYKQTTGIVIHGQYNNLLELPLEGYYIGHVLQCLLFVCM